MAPGVAAQAETRDDRDESLARKSVAAEAPADAAKPDDVADAAAPAPAPAPARTIIRTGACDIRVDDLESARRTLESLVRPDLGEYTAEATVDLDRWSPRATITVRIDASRFDAFVDSLRGIGAVRSLTITANDATDQLIDLDARLRNERRVESEVLGLLADRPDATLEDIVRVRRELSGVRESIERMEAQRQSLVSRAAFSTMRVTLIGPEPEGSRADDDRPSFSRRIGAAVTSGWRTYTNSVVWLAQFLVSGLMWWIIGAVLIWIAIRHHRWTSTWR